MKNQVLKYLIVCTLWCIQSFSFQCDKLLDYAHENLPLCGVIKNLDGFVYVDLDDNYIHELVNFISEERFQEPPYFGDGLIGAHITVIYPNEINNIDIEECGMNVPFNLCECQIVHPTRWRDVEEVYLITVEAPALDFIREKYALPKREYDFHITIGVKTTREKAS